MDTDCPSYMMCNGSLNVCMRQSVFNSTHEGLGFFLFALSMGLCTVSGIGGITLGVVILVHYFELALIQAMAVANLAIFLDCLVRYFFVLKKYNPEKPNMFVIDYPMMVILLAATLAGNQLGLQVLLA